MSHDVLENAPSNEACASSVPAESQNLTLDSTASEKSLESFVTSLQEQLNLTETKLEVAENEKSTLRSALEQHNFANDALEIPEVKNLIKNYQQRVKCLTEQISSMKQKKPDLQLVHRIDILSSINSSLGQQNLNLSGKLHDAQIEISNLKKELEQSHCESGGDVGAESKENVALLQQHLAHYYELCLSSQRKATELKEKLRLKNDENDELVKQIEVLTCERDKLKMQLGSSQRQESNATVVAMDNNNYETDKLLQQIEYISRERDQLKIQLEGASSSQPQECDPAAIYTQNLLDDYNNLLTELKKKNKRFEEHINEQESKLQNMMLSMGEYKLQVCRLNEEIEEKDLKIAELQKSVDDCKKELDTKNVDDSSETTIYQEQLKAFQDDFRAEREEKERIMKESLRIKEKNENLMQELQSRSVQFSSPPAVGPFESSTLRSGVHPTQGFNFTQGQMGYPEQSFSAARGPQSLELTTTQSSASQPHVGNPNGSIAVNPGYERSNNVPHPHSISHSVSLPQIRPQNVHPDHHLGYSYAPNPYSVQRGDFQRGYSNMLPMNYDDPGRFRTPTAYPSQNTRTTPPGSMNRNPQVSPPLENPQDRRPRRP